jgi:hypothetical protein
MAKSILSKSRNPVKRPPTLGAVNAAPEAKSIDKFNRPPARYITTYFRPMSDVFGERLDEQHRRVMEVAGNIMAAKEAWSRSGLVCGVEIGKQTAAAEASKQWYSLLELAAETLSDIAKRIDPAPSALFQPGADSMYTFSEGSSDDEPPAWFKKQEMAHV